MVYDKDLVTDILSDRLIKVDRDGQNKIRKKEKNKGAKKTKQHRF